tara:strand:+ start:723 stop:1337 length:615 start_codon:yes stop_codon:yes gene_type:complete
MSSTITNSTISDYDGHITFVCDGNPSVIQIDYQGAIQAESKLPSGFIICEANKKIFIIRLTKKKMPKSLFTYEGNFKINSTKVYNSKGGVTTSSIDRQKIRFGDTEYSWNAESKWESLRGNEYKVKKNGKSVIYNNNLHTDDFGEIKLSNGESYKGYFNYDSRGIFMTGKTMGKDSQIISPRKKRFIKRKATAQSITRNRRNNG